MTAADGQDRELVEILVKYSLEVTARIGSVRSDRMGNSMLR